MSVPDVPLRHAVAAVSRRFRTHGGRVEVVRADAEGTVEVRFGGMCSGCPTKLMCLEHTVRPGLARVPGVRAVVAPGARVSTEAVERVRTFLGDAGPRPRP